MCCPQLRLRIVDVSRLAYGLFALGLLSQTCAAQAQTLAAIRASHHFSCGTVQSVDDWNGEDIHGNLSALGAEICRAVAIAIQDTTDGFEVKVFPAEPEALGALKAGNIQLAVGISPSATVAMQYGVGFGPPVYFQLAAHHGREGQRHR